MDYLLAQKDRVNKDSPSKFNGDSKSLIEWREDFAHFITKWGIDRLLFSKADLDVSSSMKRDIDNMNDAVPPSTLYKAQNAWYYLTDAAGLPTVKQVILLAWTAYGA